LPAKDDPLELTRLALVGTPAWLVGGAVRDRLLTAVPTGSESSESRLRGVAGGMAGGQALPGGPDLDVVLDGDPREAARALARVAGRSSLGGAAAFALSDEYGGWRVVARDRSWQIDLERLRGGSLAADLALRDFTVNAIAEPLGEPGAARGRTIDPLGGIEDLAHRRLRLAGPHAFSDDPLRVLRLVRIAVELGFEPDAPARAQARAHAEGLRRVAPERVFMELSRILDAPRAVAGLRLLGEVGATPVVLPELDALRGVEQSRYHHLDVHDHTLEVLAHVIALQDDPSAALGEEYGPAIATLLAEPLADGLTRGGALRWGALLADLRSVDAAKPRAREVQADPRAVGAGRVTFVGYDLLGAQLAAEVLGRLRASGRLREHVAALVRHHLRLGFLVHQPQPLERRTVFAYLRACEPVEVDVTLLSVADRLGTSGERAQEAIDVHLHLAQQMLGDALRWRATGGPAPPLWRGDELARELGIAPGPRLGELLEELAAAQYCGELTTREQALEHARRALVSTGNG
jgi:poly(A) polymerase